MKVIYSHFIIVKKAQKYYIKELQFSVIIKRRNEDDLRELISNSKDWVKIRGGGVALRGIATLQYAKSRYNTLRYSSLATVTLWYNTHSAAKSRKPSTGSPPLNSLMGMTV